MRHLVPSHEEHAEATYSLANILVVDAERTCNSLNLLGGLMAVSLE